MYNIKFFSAASGHTSTALLVFMTRIFYKIILCARQALEFSHGQDPKQTSGLINVRGGMLDLHQLPSGREALSFKHSTNDKACSEGPYAPPQIHHASRRRIW